MDSAMSDALACGLKTKREEDGTSNASTADRPAKTVKSGTGKGKGKKDTAEDKAAATPVPSTSKARNSQQDSELLVAVARLSVNHAREIGTLSSLTYSTIIFNNEEDIGKLLADVSKKTTLNYTADAKALSPQEKGSLGPPHSYVWIECSKAILQFAADQGRSDKVKKLKDYLEALARKLQGTDNRDRLLREYILDEVLLFRVNKCWDTKQCKLQYKLQESCVGSRGAIEAMQEVKEMLCEKAKAQVKAGAPPRSEQERKVLRLLDQRN
eukprot:TRINITY_DN5844_c0_g1_i2.p2 TRINITY_DN5844_c0_g1~~TRINITY_DN5844_c0_g1_i2.p2  ORF type:complete len:269 (+),score=85.47 TRINITY_DN5844_c0_g1_i2:383-1189(+)